jgi:benzoate 4-monooxygenase
MALIDVLLTPWTLIVVVLLYYVLPYFTTYSALRSVPAPLGASFTNLWLLFHCRQGKRYLAVDNAHKRLGKIVRIQPNHVSIADPGAIQVIYGHGNGLLKSSYYDALYVLPRKITSRDTN